MGDEVMKNRAPGDAPVKVPNPTCLFLYRPGAPFDYATVCTVLRFAITPAPNPRKKDSTVRQVLSHSPLMHVLKETRAGVTRRGENQFIVPHSPRSASLCGRGRKSPSVPLLVGGAEQALLLVCGAAQALFHGHEALERAGQGVARPDRGRRPVRRRHRRRRRYRGRRRGRPPRRPRGAAFPRAQRRARVAPLHGGRGGGEGPRGRRRRLPVGVMVAVRRPPRRWGGPLGRTVAAAAGRRLPCRAVGVEGGDARLGRRRHHVEAAVGAVAVRPQGRDGTRRQGVSPLPGEGVQTGGQWGGDAEHVLVGQGRG